MNRRRTAAFAGQRPAVRVACQAVCYFCRVSSSFPIYWASLRFRPVSQSACVPADAKRCAACPQPLAAAQARGRTLFLNVVADETRQRGGRPTRRTHHVFKRLQETSWIKKTNTNKWSQKCFFAACEPQTFNNVGRRDIWRFGMFFYR